MGIDRVIEFLGVWVRTVNFLRAWLMGGICMDVNKR